MKKIKIIKNLAFLSLAFLTSCSDQVNKESSSIINKEEIKEDKKDEVSENKTNNKEQIPLNELSKNGKTYYYGSLKDAGYTHKHDDVYVKDNNTYQITKYDNYKLNYQIDGVKYTDKRKIGSYFANSNGDLTSNLEEVESSFSLNDSYNERIYKDTRETVVKSSKQAYQFNVYNINSENSEEFKTENVEGMSFVENYKEYQILEDTSFIKDEFIYKIAKFKKYDNSTTYHYIRYKKDETISKKYNAGYKYITNSIKEEDGYVAFVPVIIRYGNFSNSGEIERSNLSSHICNNCLSPYQLTTTKDELIYIKRYEFDGLVNMAGKHLPNPERRNEFTDKYLYYQVAPYSEVGSYMYKYRPAVYLPSELRLPINCKEWMNEKDAFNSFCRVENMNITYKKSFGMFNDRKIGYSKNYMNNLVRKIRLTKLRMHKLSNGLNSAQLQVVKDGYYDEYSITQEFQNYQGLFVDENIQVSKTASNNVHDLLTVKSIISDYKYSYDEEIKDYSLINDDENKQIYAIRSQIAKYNNIKVYDKYVEDVIRINIDEVIDNFVILDTFGFYSFKYNRYFKKDENYLLDYYYNDEGQKISNDDNAISKYEIKIKEADYNYENEYLYTIRMTS